MFSLSGLTVVAIELVKNVDLSNVQVVDQAQQIIPRRYNESGSRNGNVEWEKIGFVILTLINLLILIPSILFLGYTLSDLIPTLAAAEQDEHALEAPPAYECVAQKEDAVEDEASEAGTVCSQKPLTSSLRATLRRLYSISGCASLLRGLGFLIFVSTSMAAVSLGLSAIPFVPVALGILGASLICVPLNTVWVHEVISAPSSAPFWRRLPELKITYQAVTLPTLAHSLAVAVAHGVPYVVVLGASSGVGAWRGLAAAALAFLLDVFLVIPSHVILTRVQASLLHADTKTIIPLNRSNSQGGAGYLSMGEAWRSISRASWVRIAKLYVKSFIAAVAVEVTLVTLFLLEMAIIFYLKG